MNHHSATAIRVGIAAGFGTCVVYPLLIFVTLPDALTATLASLMGPLVGISGWGLRELITLDRRRVSADLGAAGNALAGALLTAMLLVQIAAGMRAGGERVDPGLVSVWLGLDVAWDIYIGLGTLFFAFAMLKHPRLGAVLGSIGLVLALLLLVLNFWTFPQPPGEAGLIDVGPLVAAWYLAVTIMSLRALPWVRARTTGHDTP